MRVYDRITLTGSKFLLSNKYTRAFLFVYTIALHLLVFSVLWQMSLHSHAAIAGDQSLPLNRNMPHPPTNHSPSTGICRTIALHLLMFTVL
jgi:hypothetical protein